MYGADDRFRVVSRGGPTELPVLSHVEDDLGAGGSGATNWELLQLQQAGSER
jgi:hypothetical protein